MTITFTKADLAKAIHTNVGISSAEAGKIVGAVFDEIINALERDDYVKISNFGSFYSKIKQAREGRNPKTAEVFEIKSRRVVSFYPSSSLKYRINI